MLQLLKHEVSNYFADMGSIQIYNHLTNQLINQSTISGVRGLTPIVMLESFHAAHQDIGRKRNRDSLRAVGSDLRAGGRFIRVMTCNQR